MDTQDKDGGTKYSKKKTNGSTRYYYFKTLPGATGKVRVSADEYKRHVPSVVRSRGRKTKRGGAHQFTDQQYNELLVNGTLLPIPADNRIINSTEFKKLVNENLEKNKHVISTFKAQRKFFRKPEVDDDQLKHIAFYKLYKHLQHSINQQNYSLNFFEKIAIDFVAANMDSQQAKKSPKALPAVPSSYRRSSTAEHSPKTGLNTSAIARSTAAFLKQYGMESPPSK